MVSLFLLLFLLCTWDFVVENMNFWRDTVGFEGFSIVFSERLFCCGEKLLNLDEVEKYLTFFYSLPFSFAFNLGWSKILIRSIFGFKGDNIPLCH